MYLTQDCFTGDIGDPYSDPDFDYGYAMSLLDSDLNTWGETHFPWTVYTYEPTITSYSLIGSGYCSDYIYLPEEMGGEYPPMQPEGSDFYNENRLLECANMCDYAYGPIEAFYVWNDPDNGD